ncbi:MAG: C-GCAxxG-C-C family protein [Bacillota bacterium]|jgi:C_GCAxxG_C_C family probable redox protein|nr:C_GCAxxG_C_C family protein [Candidatus Fermentithermobacillaceae bacterium]
MEEVRTKRLSGFNCAEAVFWGVTRSVGLDVTVSCAADFGGGIGGSGSVCGALCGAVAAAGVYTGRTQPEDEEAKTRCSAISREIVRGFVNGMGSQLCQDILGYAPWTRPRREGQPTEINPKCKQAVALALELAIKEIKKDQCRVSRKSNQER